MPLFHATSREAAEGIMSSGRFGAAICYADSQKSVMSQSRCDGGVFTIADVDMGTVTKLCIVARGMDSLWSLLETIDEADI
jgi:hypothetical protein